MKNYDEQALREEYTPKKQTGLDEAKRLAKKAKLPVYIFSYSFGVIGTILLGVGMCLTMEIIWSGIASLIIGIIVGILGIVMISINYPLYTKYLSLRKEKYASQIILALNKDQNK